MPVRFWLAVLLITGLVQSSSFAAAVVDSITFKDGATTKIMKPPRGLPIPPIETANKYSSSGTFVIAVPGVTGAQFTKTTLVKITFQEGGSNSTDYNVEFTLGDDPKYVDGAAGAKITKPVNPNVPPNAFNVAYTAQVKIGRDAITVIVVNKILPLYAQQFINFGGIPNGVRFPEGKSSHTKAAAGAVMFGAITKTFPSLTYSVNTNNKKVPKTSPQLWTGSAAGSIKFPQ